MNYLSIDYGTKRVGFAYSVAGIIQPLPPHANDPQLIDYLNKLIKDYQIGKIYVGLCEGKFKLKTLKFVDQLENLLKLPIETVEEAVSTIEAESIVKTNRTAKKNHFVDSVAAAVILSRVID
ncbi:MAG TPA: Holliday junction resolvase RuvX [Candidatus Woesebacteria bacterium]|nr:Holliday junction resolvase RuvX [Candidatus Woesebacteria bacterium]